MRDLDLKSRVGFLPITIDFSNEVGRIQDIMLGMIVGPELM
jgi:hypothetical protein